MSMFKDNVIKVVNEIPSGKVMTFGQVALYVGSPRAARQVGWILNQLEDKLWLPWWRVVNSSGYLSVRGCKHYDKNLMKKLLESEGVLVSDEYTVDLDSYRYHPTEDELKKWQLPKEIQLKIHELL